METSIRQNLSYKGPSEFHYRNNGCLHLIRQHCECVSWDSLAKLERNISQRQRVVWLSFLGQLGHTRAWWKVNIHHGTQSPEVLVLCIIIVYVYCMKGLSSFQQLLFITQVNCMVFYILLLFNTSILIFKSESSTCNEVEQENVYPLPEISYHMRTIQGENAFDSP